jgi:hypothetical protein
MHKRRPLKAVTQSAAKSPRAKRSAPQVSHRRWHRGSIADTVVAAAACAAERFARGCFDKLSMTLGDGAVACKPADSLPPRRNQMIVTERKSPA